MKRTKPRLSLTQLFWAPRPLVLALVYGVAWPAQVLAAPQGEKVVRGSATFVREGNVTTIRASDKAIINYQKFGIGQNETVEFVQPNEAARVLNRVTGFETTQIDGSLRANGIVYILNPQGIFFGSEAIVDVGGMVAAAGHMSNDDFMKGIDHFTQLEGTVANAGDIQGRVVSLLGRQVTNIGSIRTEDGVIAMVAGDEIWLGPLHGHVMVKINTRELQDGVGIQNTGTLDAGQGRVSLAAGDMYAVAAQLGGTVRGKDIQVAGGEKGLVEVTGTLDASDRAAGQTGGNIEVTGDRIALREASLDASGDAGGGTIHVGGAFQGKGETPTASRTYVSKGSTLRADAETRGDGGEVVVWADRDAHFHGSIQSRGGAEGGNGGRVETSGKAGLAVGGTARVDTRAPNGSAGSWLLDPQDIRVRDNNSDTNDTTVGFGDAPQAGELVVDSDAVNAAMSPVVLQAERDVVFVSTVNNTNDGISLTVQAGDDITISAPLTMDGDITLSASDPGAAAATTDGTITVDDPIISTDHAITLTAHDVDLNDTVDSGTARTTVIDRLGGIGFGTVIAGSLNLSDAELTNIDAGALTLRTAGNVVVDQIDANDAGDPATIDIEGSGVAFTSNPSTFRALNVHASGDVNVAQNITATDAIAFEDSDDTGIGLGAATVVNGLVLSQAEIDRIFANGFTLQTDGTLTANAVTTDADQGAVTLTADRIVFEIAPSSFASLAATADDGIDVDANVTTTTGNLALDGDLDNAADGDDSIDFTAGRTLTSAGGLTLEATTGDIQGAGALTLTANGGTIALNDALTAGGATALNATEGIDVNANVTTTAGNLSLDGDSNNANDTGDDRIDFAAGTVVTSAATLTLDADTGDIAGAGALTLQAADLVFDDPITTTGATTVVAPAEVSLGAAGLGLNLSDAELDLLNPGGAFKITAIDDVTVDGVSSLHSSFTIDPPPTVTFSGAASTFAGDLVVEANDGINVLTDVTSNQVTAGASSFDADFDNNGTGTMVVGTAADLNVTLSTTNSPLTITASDVSIDRTAGMESSITSGTASTTIVDSDDDGINLNPAADVVGDVNLSNAELAGIAANGLIFRTGEIITATGATTAAAQGPVTLDAATIGAAGQIVFSGATSTFSTLTANADNGVQVNADVTTTAGNLALDGDADGNAAGTVAFGGAGARTLDATAGSITLNGGTTMTAAAGLNLTADDGITLAESLSTNGVTTIDADDDANDNNGTFTVATGETLTTTNNAFSVTANDVDLFGSINTGTAATTIVDSDGTGIGLGATAVANGLNLDGTELQQITANGLTLQTTGAITVNGITAANSDTVNTVTLDAGTTIAFATAASTFDGLLAQADAGITVGADVATDTSDLTLDGDADNNAAGTVAFTGTPTLDAAGILTLDGGTAMTGTAGLNLIGDDGVVFAQSLTTNGATTIDADDDTDGTGDFTVALGQTIATTNGTLSVTANDIALAGSLNSGTAATTIIDSDGTGIGLGATAVANGLNLSGGELQQITANGLTLQSAGAITVNGITEPNSDTLNTVTLDAGTTIAFTGAASTFDGLDAGANTGITVAVDLTTDTSSLALDGDDDANGTGAVAFTGLRTLDAAGLLTLDGGVPMTGTAGLVLTADDGITLAESLTTNGVTTIDADNDANDNVGTFTVATGETLSTTNNALSVTANDVDLAGSTTSGAAATTIVDSDGTGIGLGATPVANGLNLSGAELQRITARALTLQTAGPGPITVDGITAANSDNVNTVTLDSATTIGFTGAASTFDGLLAQADAGITVGANVATDTSDLTLDGDADNNAAGTVAFTGTPTLDATGILTLDGGTAMTGTAGLNLIGDDGVVFAQSLTTNGATTIDADDDTDGTGDFTVALGQTIATTNGTLSVTANDIALAGSLNSGTAATTIVDSDDSGINLNPAVDVAGDLNLSNTELGQITSNGLTFRTGGTITATGVTTTATQGAVTLDATTGTTGQVVFGGTPSSFLALTADADNGIQIDADVTTTNGQTYNDDVTLGANTTLTSTGGGNLLLAGALGGAFDFTANTTGTTTLGGPVNVASVTTDAGGTTALGGGTVTTTGAQTYNDAVTLAAATTLTSTGAGNLTLASTLGGAFGFTANTTGTTTLGGAVNVASVATDAGGTTAINGGTVTTSGAQTYDDAVTLGANTTLASTGGGNLTLGAGATGAFDLVANTVGTTSLTGPVGVASVTTDAGGTTTLAGTITTTGAQTYNDAVTLAAAATLASTGAGNLTLASTLGGAFDFTANTTGTTTLGGAVNVASVATDAGGTTAINGGTVTTSGAQSYGDAVTLGANTTLASTGGGNLTLASTLDGAFGFIANTTGATTLGGAVNVASVATNAGGTTAINGGSVTTSGAQSYGDAVTLGANTTFASTGGGNLAFANTLGGAFDFIANTTGTTTLGGAVNVASVATDAGGTTAINGGTVTTSGAQSYGDAVTLGANTTLASTGGGNLTLGAGATGAFDLVANTVGTTSLTGPVGVASVTTDAGGTTTLAGTITTTGAQTYNDAVTLAAATTLTSTGAGNLTLASTLGGAFDFTANTTGTTTLGGAVNVASVATNAGGTTAINGGTVTTSGAQSYGDAVTLGANTTLASTGGGNLTLGAGATGAFDLVANTVGTTSLTGPVGVASVTTDAGGTTTLAGTITTTGAQTYNDAVTLAAATTLASTGAGNLTLASTLGGAFDFTANTTGTTTLGGAVNVASVATDAGGTTAINGGTVTTSGAQSYGDAVTLGANTTLASTGGGNLTLGAGATGAFDLVANTVGTTSLTGPVGVASVTTDAGGTTTLAGTITTTGAQTYNDAVTLAAATTLASTGAGNLTLASTLGGAFDFTANTTGTTTLGGAVNVASVATDAGGTTAINGGTVTTSGAQSYGDAVTLGANTTLASTGGGNLTLANTLDGAFGFIANTTGATAFGGAVNLASVATNAGGTTAINGGSVTTSGAQSYGDAVTLGANTTLASTGGGNLTFANTLGGAFDLIANTTGTTAFGGAVNVASVATDAGGTTAINGGTVTTSGAQSYGDAVTLGANTTLASTGGGNLTLASTLDGAFGFIANTTGTTTLGGAVNVASVATDAGGTTAINGGTVTTSGAQSYGDAVALGSNTTLASTGGGNLTLGAGATGAFDLVANTAGRTSLTGPVSIASVTTNAGGTTALAGTITTTGAQTYNDAVTLAADATVASTGAGNLRFGSTVSGGSALTANTAGTTTFVGAVDIADLTTDAGGTTAINGGSVTTSGRQQYGDAVTLGANTTLRSGGTSNIALADTLNGPFALTVDTGGLASFRGDIGGSSRLTSFQSRPRGTILFGANVDVFANTLRFGFTGAESDNLDRLDPSNLATAATVAGEGTLAFNTTSFAMGRGEKLTVAGGLTINSSSSAKLSDLNALTVNINAPSIELLSRPAGNVILTTVDANGSSLGTPSATPDDGMDIVANSIRFSSLPTISPLGAQTFSVVLSTANGSDVTGAVPTDQQFAQRAIFSTLRPLTAGDLSGPVAGGSPSDTAPDLLGRGVVVSGCLDCQNSSLINQDETSLWDLAEAPEPPPTPDEVLAFLNECDPEEDPDCKDEEGEGAAPQLGNEAAIDAQELYRELVKSKGTTDRVGPVLQAGVEHCRQSGAGGGTALRSCLASNSEYADAVGYLDRLELLFAQFTKLGLAPGGLQSMREEILTEIISVLSLEGITPQDLGEAIGPSASLPEGGTGV